MTSKRALALAAFIIFPGSGGAAAAQPSKSKWLKTAITAPLRADRWNAAIKVIDYSLKRCALSYTYDVAYAYDSKLDPAFKGAAHYASNFHKRDTFTVSLKDVDPSSGVESPANDSSPIYFHTSASAGALRKISFKTRAGAGTVNFRVRVFHDGRWTNNANFEQAYFEFVFKDSETAEKVRESLVREIKACGEASGG